MQVLSASSRNNVFTYPPPKALGKLTYPPPLEPMAAMSWLSEIPDDSRVQFGFGYSRNSILDTTGDWTDLGLYRKVLTEELRKVTEKFKNSMWDYTNIFVRDIDCKGHNRLYQFRVVEEYNCHNLLGCIAACISRCRRGVYCKRKHGFLTAVINRRSRNSIN
jgi:hypothetical protein